MRFTARKFIQDFAAEHGVEFALSPSAAEQEAGVSGIRLAYWAKDVLAKYQHDRISSKSIFSLIDVDYYVDMPELLTKAKPVILYSFVPQQCAGQVDSDTSFQWAENGDVIVHVHDSGTKYRHPLWDYGTDSSLVTNYLWPSVLGKLVAISTTIVGVERLPVGRSRQVIGLFPQRTIYWPFASAAAKLQAVPVKRINPVTVVGEHAYAKYKVYLPSRCVTCISRVHTSAGAMVDSVWFDSYVAQELSKAKYGKAAAILSSDLTNWLKFNGLTLPTPYGLKPTGFVSNVCQVLNGYLADQGDPYVAHDFAAPQQNALSYQFPDKDGKLDPDPKEKIYQWMNPLVDRAYAPSETRGNDQECINSRLKDIASDKALSDFPVHLRD